MKDNRPDPSSLELWAHLNIRDYAACRRRFLDLSAAHGASVTSYMHPGQGPSGEQLGCDVARFGSARASRVLIVTSGTHGLEGRAGSAIQSAWMDSGAVRALPDDVAVLLVHAINPYGFAFERRNEATNVDPNRNFAANLTSFPDNPGYRELHPILCPREWTANTAQEINTQLRDYSARHGFEQFKQAVAAGQAEFPDGLFFCGAEQTWPVRTIREILTTVSSRARHVGYIDLHTGMGAYAETVHLCFHPSGSPGRLRARRWFGADAIDPAVRPDGQSERYEGTMYDGIERCLAERNATIICLEFGTVDPMRILNALLLEHWLHFHGQKHEPGNGELLRSVREALIPPDAAWLSRVRASGTDSIDKAIRGLANEP